MKVTDSELAAFALVDPLGGGAATQTHRRPDSMNHVPTVRVDAA
jgi:hypothetical protein